MVYKLQLHSFGTWSIDSVANLTFQETIVMKEAADAVAFWTFLPWPVFP